MNARDHFLMLARYHVWATRDLLDRHVWTLSDTEYRRDVGLFFIAPGDVDPGDSVDSAAARAEQKLTQVLAEMREAHDLTALYIEKLSGRPLALVVSRLVQLGVANMISTIAEMRGASVRAFRDRNEAETWLQSEVKERRKAS